MYAAIVIRANCLFSHSKYLDSSLLVFSLWVDGIFFFLFLCLYQVFPAAAARNKKNFILKKRGRVMSAQKRNHRIILSKITNSKTNIQILQIIGQNIKILLMRQFLKHLIFIRHLFIKYQCLCLLYNIHTHTHILYITKNLYVHLSPLNFSINIFCQLSIYPSVQNRVKSFFLILLSFVLACTQSISPISGNLISLVQF